jgi:hypothetical protein
LNLVNNEGGNGAGIELHGSGATLANGLRIYNTRVGPIMFEAADGFEALRITADALVGIGTDTPDEVVHIVGNLKVEGNVIASGASEAHGFIFTDGGSGTQALAAATPVKATAFANVGSEYLCTGDAGNDQITVGTAGVYQISAQFSFTSSVSNVVAQFHVAKGGATQAIGCRRKIGTGADVGSCSLSGVLALAAGDIVSVNAEVDTGATLTYVDAQLNLHKM